jgi:uncharacterized protein
MAWWQWALPVLLAVAGLAIGFSIGRLKNDGVKRSIQLDQELHETRAELERYRNRVIEHFTTTADLVNQLTADYRAVYEHLANGAQQLAGSQVPRLEAIASSRERLVEPPAGGIAEGLHEDLDGEPEEKSRKAGNGSSPSGGEGRKTEGWYDDAAPGTEVPDYAREERYR